MIRIIKPKGFGNIRLQDAPVPEISERQVLVRTEATLISRGSELFRRYINAEEVPQRTMGYSLAGTVEQIGAAVTEYRVGQRVFVTAPHDPSSFHGQPVRYSHAAAGLPCRLPRPHIALAHL